MQGLKPEAKSTLRDWVHDRALTIVLMAMFALLLAGQFFTGWHEYNEARLAHGDPRIEMSAYFGTGHLWESVFENWESEFLQMAVFILLTTCLVQKGSPESRRPHAKERVWAHWSRRQCVPTRHTLCYARSR